jgi:hypothetical protein
MTASEVRQMLRRECHKAGSIRAWATARGLDPALVTDVCDARQKPRLPILQHLGLKRHDDYRWD